MKYQVEYQNKYTGASYFSEQFYSKLKAENYIKENPAEDDEICDLHCLDDNGETIEVIPFP